ncbi:MAG: hypothetical protein M1831_005173 [Alyxoria varia]|nr:MAG: hypothetical protein M1831_005173 [Alyxoria varia]
MSWKLTKKLKDTHLAPSLSNPFSRSSSTSTVVSSEAESTSSSEASEVPSEKWDPKGIAASEAMTNPPADPAKPGILIVTIHEGAGFHLEKDDEDQFLGKTNSNGASDSARPSSTSLAHGNVPHGAGGYGRPKTSGGSINSVPTIHGRYSSKYLPYALVDFDKQQIFVNGVSGSPENPIWAGDSTQYKFDVSRAQEVAISVYIRNPNANAEQGRKKDFCIGTCRISPRLEERKKSMDQTKKDERNKEIKHCGYGVDWQQIENQESSQTCGQIRVGLDFVENRQRSLKIDDFDLLKVVGKGSFGKVMQVKKKDTGRIYALKTIRKMHIINRSEVSHTLAERSVLAQINNPFIVPLKFSFQSPEKLYLVLAFVNGGELFHHLQNERVFPVNRARFYAAELLSALECLHGFNVIYRDLKPENILLDYSGHIALCDFGLCKLDMKDEDRTNTFCGTPEYLAPELLRGSGYTKAVDWWTLGVLLYEMLTGLPPFYDENTNEMYAKILSAPLEFHNVPESQMPPQAVSILKKLLDRRPEHRLGAKGAEAIRHDEFFRKIEWGKLLARKYEPMFRPKVADQLDTANFDAEFTAEAPTDSYVEGPMLSQTMQQQFAGWSYNRPVAGLGDAGGSVKDPSFGSVVGRK